MVHTGGKLELGAEQDSHADTNMGGRSHKKFPRCACQLLLQFASSGVQPLDLLRTALSPVGLVLTAVLHPPEAPEGLGMYTSRTWQLPGGEEKDFPAAGLVHNTTPIGGFPLWFCMQMDSL